MVQFDNMQQRNLLVDGRPAAEAPAFVYTPTAVEADSAFAAGSAISTQTLSPVQVDNLARLGRVWGFAKDHHPRVTAGEVNWDAELFRVMPGILDASDVASANRRMARRLR